MAKVIMIQGTMSNVGKSLITAGLCRVFMKDGYRVAPFKSQNMALNSYITLDGLEIGRAQAMQAEACNRRPTADMNPILLKPTTNVGSQVIINGRSIGNMPAKEYFACKKKFIPDILNAFERLSGENDIIVIEGAGSPAEINLKKDDIVNMGLAGLLNAPVLLVGDIDRGGVFAQLYGTVSLLDEEEKRRIKGLIINKFRGDVSILRPGLEEIKRLCNKDIIGVMPYVTADIEDEDSLSDRLLHKGNKGIVDIAVIRLPKISNYTDFGPLEALSGISLRYVCNINEMKNPDIIIIPGTKNTIEDLKWLKTTGIGTVICKRASEGCLVIGICGGYQMLGRLITDEEAVEGGGRQEGLGLLGVNTIFKESKTTRQTMGVTYETGFTQNRRIPVTGYEIHMGCTTYESGARPFIQLSDGSLDGCAGENVIGTYLHGIFENEEFVTAIIEYVCSMKNISWEPEVGCYSDYKQKQFDILADAVRSNLDMQKIYNILENND